MRIPTVLIPDLKGLIADKAEQTKMAAALKVGDSVSAKLVAIQADFAVILVSGQRMSIPAHTVSDYVLGDVLPLEVAENTEKGIVFSVLPKSQELTLLNQAVQTSSNLTTELKGQLRALGFLPTELNSEVVESLKAFNVPITKEAITLVKEQLFYIKDSVQTLKEIPQALTAEHWHDSPKEFVQSTLTSSASNPSTLSVPRPDVSMDDETSIKLQVQDKVIDTETTKQTNSNVTKELESGVTKHITEASFSKHLSEQINETLSNSIKSDQSLIETLAFMQRHKLPVTLFNVTLIQRQLSGDIGFFKGLNELFSALESPLLPEKNIIELLSKLETAVQKNIFSKNELDVEQMKEQIKSAQEFSVILKELKTSSEPDRMQAQLDVIQKAQEVLKSANEWSTILVPITIQKQIEDLEIYIKKDVKGKRTYNPDDFLIYIAISTENLQRLRIKIQTKKSQLTVTFIAENDAIKEQLKESSNLLLDTLQTKSDKRVIIGFEAWEEAPNLATLERLEPPNNHGFDVLI